jgi:predicted nuclease with TOPRIM domain
MTTPAEYREIAEECMEAMRSTASPEVRAELLRLALRWDELADEMEHRREIRVTDLLSRTPSTSAVPRYSNKYFASVGRS